MHVLTFVLQMPNVPNENVEEEAILNELRLADYVNELPVQDTHFKELANLLGKHFGKENLATDSSNRSLTSSVVHPRSVFNAAITSNSCSFIVSHNHPSGDPYPSTEDRNLTRALEEGGNILGIPLLDHVIIGDGRYYSMKEHGDIN